MAAAMNNNSEVFSPVEFVDEINFSDLDLQEIVGRGAFGTVQRAVWNGETVAIKIIDMSQNIKEYQDEVEQLSKVRHKNIIRLFGTSIHKTKVYIVMEYADCGSLYNLLHPPESDDAELIPYNLGHVFSWSLQCAEAVEYLHSLDPKVIHRDLKPPNMLLLEYGMVVKICDFGTATQIHTEMTSNKGSAAWMAPEVFEGKRYSEKCDVYSFGIVLWEMLSRKKPFDEIGPPAFRILWAVYNGTRPPPLQGISESLLQLMQSCWAKDQSKRPSFSEIVKYFKTAATLVKGGDLPLWDFDDMEYYENEEAPSLKENPVESPNWDGNNFFPKVELDISPYQPHPSLPLPDIPPLPQTFYPPPIITNPNTNPEFMIKIPSPDHMNPPDYSQMSPHSITPSSSTNTTPHNPFSKKSPDYQSISTMSMPVDDELVVKADWGVVPQHLMPVKPINGDDNSIKMYKNYTEALQKFIDLQMKIKQLTVQKDNLDKQINEVNKEQKNNAYYLERYLKLDHDKSNLLELHRTINSTLESEKARRMRVNPRLHSP